MEYKITRVRHLRKHAVAVGRARRRPIIGLLLLLIAGALGMVSACSPTAVGAPSQSYTFYLGTWAEGEHVLTPLDPQTLEAQPESKVLQAAIHAVAGTRGVNVEYPEGRGSLDPDDIWIVVYSMESGLVQSRFHPPVRGSVTGLSRDGSRLLLQPDSHPPSRYPPPVEWYVIDTGSGEVLSHVKDERNACFRQSLLLHPTGEHIYCLVDPALAGVDGPQPAHIIAYDSQSGNMTGKLDLPEVLVGGEEIEMEGRAVHAFMEPAVALSPDGRRLAVVHADSDTVTLIDSGSFTVEKSISQASAATLWQRLGVAPGTAHAKGEMQGTIRQATFSTDGQYLYVFSQQLRINPKDTPAERGLWLLNLERGRITAEALPQYQIQWLMPAPDGTVYAFGTSDKDLLSYEVRTTSPSMLWRLDGRTLDILARRAFTGYRYGRLVPGADAVASGQPVSAAAEAEACPVTQPPTSPFIPPPPWPAEPPDDGQFWFGDNNLWTTLPADGSWRQLALGEKFWWWSQAFDVNVDPAPALTITARRLDGDAPALHQTGATNGYHESFHWAMLAGVTVASPGCWEFTGQYNGHELSFVLWVPAE